MSVNPYESPRADLGTPAVQRVGPQAVRVEGKDLLIYSGTVLPARCVKTNQAVPEGEMIPTRFHWTPHWVYVMFLVNILIMLFAYYLARKPCDLTFAVHREVRSKYRKRIIYKLLIALAMLVLLIPLDVAYGNDAATIAVVIAVVIAFLAVFLGNAPLKVAAHQDGLFSIRGCSREFLASLSKPAASARAESSGW